jgi:hypothetical protein
MSQAQSKRFATSGLCMYIIEFSTSSQVRVTADLIIFVARLTRAIGIKSGRDFNPDNILTVPEQVDKLILQATSLENLCQCFSGWCVAFKPYSSLDSPDHCLGVLFGSNLASVILAFALLHICIHIHISYNSTSTPDFAQC